MAAKGGAESLAGERAALAGVEEDDALHTVAAADVLQHLDAQFRFHVVVHMEALDAGCSQSSLAPPPGRASWQSMGSR